MSVCIVTCIYVLYKVSELVLWLKSSEKEQNKEEEKEASAWQVRRCGFGINDGRVYSHNCNIVIFTHVSCVWIKRSLMLPTRTFLMLMETDHRATGTSLKDKFSGSSRR